MNLVEAFGALGSRLRSLLRDVWIYALYLSGALARAKSQIRSDAGALVLTLHRVLPERERTKTLSAPGMVMSEQTFASMVRYLSTEHLVFSLDAPHKSSHYDRRIAIAITFDDGWEDNATYAQPILARHAMPAAIFLCPEKMGKRIPFWPEKLNALFRSAKQLRKEKEFRNIVTECAHLPEAERIAQSLGIVETVKRFPPHRRDLMFERLEQMGFGTNLEESTDKDSTMSWEHARGLVKHGFVLGSHTLDHEILTQIPVDKVREEIGDSRERLIREIGQPCFAFAYPNGNWSPAIRAVTISAGYDMAFANIPGLWTLQTDIFTVPRVGLWEGAVSSVRGYFSVPHFEYVVFWKTIREARKASRLNAFRQKNQPKASFATSAT